MTPPSVHFEHVWKKFRRGERHNSIRDLIPSLARRLVGSRNPGELDGGTSEFWAIKDLSFEVAPGEALGIIGPNGAGKSTTLKLLTRILKPTMGRIAVTGRIGALIEVAAGFHPDLTGRENIFLQGAVMGMGRAEVKTRFDEIVAFAGVDEFIDTPVKRYSSGMNARLGFSIAAHLDPQVLIIDEVLSVGDTAFQQRCVNRMLQFRQRGVTIVFVSHDLQAISTLSHRVLYLRRNDPVIGTPQDAISAYLRDSSASNPHDVSGPIHIHAATLMDTTGHEVLSAPPSETLTLRVDYQVERPIAELTLGLILYRSTDNLIVYEGTVAGTDIGLDSTQLGRHQVDFAFKTNLTRGHYHVESYVIHTPTHEYISRLSPAAMFAVDEDVTCRGVADIELVASLPGIRQVRGSLSART